MAWWRDWGRWDTVLLGALRRAAFKRTLWEVARKRAAEFVQFKIFFNCPIIESTSLFNLFFPESMDSLQIFLVLIVARYTP